MTVAPASPTSLPSGPTGDAPVEALVAALRGRDESAYLELVRRYTPLMLWVARNYVTRREVAQDVVQDTWVAVLNGLDRFEGRSSFKTWLMAILVNTARNRRRQERRTVCWSSLPGDASSWDGAMDAGDPEPGPDRQAVARETWVVVRSALGRLPQRQRTVVILRDVEGWTSDEVCRALGLSAGNQRVLLHRGRIRLRGLLAPYLQQDRSEIRRGGGGWR